MRVITVARKPPNGTVAQNALQWGVGGLNIDACRIKGGGQVSCCQSDPRNRSGVVGTALWDPSTNPDKFQQAQRESVERTNQLGRWPADVILQHPSACLQDGVKRVKGHSLTLKEGQGGERRIQCGPGPRPAGVELGHADADGLETVAAWECAPGCPVPALDEQSGVRPTGSWNRYQGLQGYVPGHDTRELPEYTNWQTVAEAPGGASRYFKQVKRT